MSGEVTGWVLRHGPLDRAERSVLLVIADAANRDGRHAHPGIAAIVEGSLYTRSTVYAVLRRLEAGGWIEVEEVGGGRGKATVYRVVRDRQTVRPSDPSPAGNGPMEEPKRSDQPPETVQLAEVAPLIQRKEQRNEQRALGTPEFAFAEFWNTYPPRDGKRLGRKDAEAQWAKLTPLHRAEAVVGAGYFAEAVAAGGRFGIPDAFRWLRDRKWEEWQEPAVITPVRQLQRRPTAVEQSKASIDAVFDAMDAATFAPKELNA